MMKSERPQLHRGRGYGGGEIELLGHRRTRRGWRWRVVLEWCQRQGRLPINGEFTAVFDEVI